MYSMLWSLSQLDLDLGTSPFSPKTVCLLLSPPLPKVGVVVVIWVRGLSSSSVPPSS